MNTWNALHAHLLVRPQHAPVIPRQREVLETGLAGPVHSGTQPPSHGGGVVITFTYTISKHHSRALSSQSTHVIITITIIGMIFDGIHNQRRRHVPVTCVVSMTRASGEYQCPCHSKPFRDITFLSFNTVQKHTIENVVQCLCSPETHPTRGYVLRVSRYFDTRSEQSRQWRAINVLSVWPHFVRKHAKSSSLMMLFAFSAGL
jgi:hypothetical protein